MRSTSSDADKHWYWTFYLRKVDIIQRRDGPGPALKLLDRAAIPDGPEFRELQALEKLQRAKAALYLSDYAAASALAEKAKALAIAAGSTNLQFDVAFWRANSLMRQRDWNGALESVREAGQIASIRHEKTQQALVLETRGLIDLRRSRFEEAIGQFEQELPEIPSDRPDILAAAMNNLGWCTYKLGDSKRALDNFQRGLELARKVSNTNNEQMCLGNIGNIYKDQGDFTEARRYYTEAINLNRGDRESIAKWYGNLADIAIQSQDWKTADDYNGKQLKIDREIGARDGESYALYHAALIAFGKRDISEAEALFQQAIQSGSDDPSPKLNSQTGLAKLYAATDRPEKAEREFQAVLFKSRQTRSHLVKTEYKMSYLDSKIGFYRDYVDFLMTHGRQARALEIVEASRAQILSDRLGVDYSPRALRGGQYKRLAAQSHAVLLSYWLAPERSYVWVITPGDITAVPLPPETQITKLVETYRAFIENLHNPLDSDEASGKALYEALVSPLIKRIPQGGRVIIIPDGPLYALNFETLPVSQPAPHYLIDDVVTSIAPSLNVLAAGSGRTSTGEELLLIGDPDSTDGHFPRLQYARAEITAVERHFGAKRVEQFRESKAVPAAYTGANARNFRYVHFTAHALADRLNPLDSAIMLSGPGDAGRLTAKSVLDKPVDAELITLSACDTAGSRTYAGEGLVGFTWAFLHAGARNVIGGLWDVSDESTPQIMDRLYAGIDSGEELAQALWAAKRAVMHSTNQYRLPYYWGPFQLYTRELAGAAPRPNHRGPLSNARLGGQKISFNPN